MRDNNTGESEYIVLFGSIKNYSEKVKLGYEINCIRIRGF